MDRREHFVTEPRGGEGKPERFPNVVAELVRLQVDMIVAPLAHPAPGQTGNGDDPRRHDGHRRPRGPGICPSLGGGSCCRSRFDQVGVHFTLDAQRAGK